MDMRSPDRPLEHGPEGFQRIDVSIAIRPLLATVINGGVFVSERGQDTVGNPFIGTNTGSFGDLAGNLGDQRLAGCVRNDLGVNLAVPLQHT